MFMGLMNRDPATKAELADWGLRMVKQEKNRLQNYTTYILKVIKDTRCIRCFVSSLSTFLSTTSATLAPPSESTRLWKLEENELHQAWSCTCRERTPPVSDHFQPQQAHLRSSRHGRAGHRETAERARPPYPGGICPCDYLEGHASAGPRRLTGNASGAMFGVAPQYGTQRSWQLSYKTCFWSACFRTSATIYTRSCGLRLVEQRWIQPYNKCHLRR
jgi:hypothetical protein